MKFLTCAFFIVSIVFMSIFIFLGIWSFVIYLKSYRQKRYQNYILEKINQKLSLLCDNTDNSDKNKYAYLTGEEDFDFADEDNIKSDEDNIKLDNITDLNKQEKLGRYRKHKH